MIPFISSRCGKLVGILVAITGLTAASTAQSKSLPIAKREMLSAPVVDSTYSVFPQINETYGQRKFVSPNPGRPLPVDHSGDGLLPTVGGVLPFARGVVGPKFAGIGFTGFTPPDITIGVGPSHIVQTVNLNIAFFDKATGQKQFQQSLESDGFFSGVADLIDYTDPKVFFDQVSQRFFVILLNFDLTGNKSQMLLAVSDDSNPNGVWTKYKIDTKVTDNGKEYWLDYPGFGYNKDGLVFTGNMFGFQSGFLGAQIVVVPKAALLAGQQPTVTKFMDKNTFSVQVAHTMDALAPRIYMSSLTTTSKVTIFSARDITTTPVVEYTTVTVPTYVRADGAPSRGGAILDTLGDRNLNSMYRNGRIVFAHSAAVSAQDNRVMCRWYEVGLNNWPISGQPTLLQTGNVVGKGSENLFLPAIASNKWGDITLIFTRSSATISADVMIASRTKADPPGAIGSPVQLVTSSANYYAGDNRWGDYFGVVTDPADDGTYWGSGQTIKSSYAWGTEVSKWKVSDGTGGGGGGGETNKFDPIGVSTYQGAFIGGDLTSITKSDDAFYEIRSIYVNRLGSVAAAETTYLLDRPANQVTAVRLNNEVIHTLGTDLTGQVFAYNWLTNSYDYISAFTVRNSGNERATTTISSGLSQYINSSNNMKFVVRLLVPATRQGSGTSYLLRMDQQYIGADVK